MAVGKDRKDKFYHLAKEIGFRSRASFKLVQLNRKYGFLDKSKTCIDLCAAPGGWMQVAQKTMQPNSLIIGIDQDPIKPLDKCISLQEDIMGEKCLKDINRALKHWKADVVLCDGAPHYGEDFKVQTIVQNKLVIRSLEIATKTLQKDGWFVTKIAKTRYFDSIIGTLAQLFKKVYVTKPEASRKESSECYAICRGFLAPKKIDKDLLEIDSILKDSTDVAVIKSVNDIFKMKPKKIALNLGHIPTKCNACDFVKCENYLDVLAGSYQISFDDIENEEIKNHPLTTQNIIEICKDLKMIDKRNVKLLLKWRREILKQITKKEKSNIETDRDNYGSTENDESVHKKTSVKQIIDDELKEKRKAERKSRKRAEKATKFTTEATVEEELFDIEKHTKMTNSNNIDYFEVDEASKNIPDALFEQNETTSRPSKHKYVSSNEWIQNLMLKNKIDADIGEEEFSDDAIDEKEPVYQERVKPKKVQKLKKKVEPESKSKKDKNSKEMSMKPQELTAEELALATAMASSKKRKRDIIENSVGRYMTFDDDKNLPDWFVEDEKKARKPLSREGISEQEIETQKVKLAKKGRVNSRCLSKLAEVRARKKRKLDSKLSKANSAAQDIMDNEFTPTNIKVKKMRDLYRNMLKKKEKKYIVTKKKHDGRMPKNVKGPYKMVDRKMKKDKPRGKNKK